MFRKIFIIFLIIAILGIIGYLIYSNISVVDNSELPIQDNVDSNPQQSSTDIVGNLSINLINIKSFSIEQENRSISLKNLNSDPYTIILNELKKVPQNSNLISPIPKNCNILDISVAKDLLTLDLSNEFIKQDISNDLDTLILKSIVSTISNLKEIHNIKFNINGNTSSKFGKYDLSNSFSNSSFK